MLAIKLTPRSKEGLRRYFSEPDGVLHHSEFYFHLGETTARLFYSLAKPESERTKDDKVFLRDIAKELSNSLEVHLEEGSPVFFRFL